MTGGRGGCINLDFHGKFHLIMMTSLRLGLNSGNQHMKEVQKL